MPSLFPHPGPTLPPFKTLLVKGDYHPSAPIHLALSCTSEVVDSGAILISSSRHSLLEALRKYNDEWLKLHAGTGRVCSLTSRIKLFYPPTPAHLCLLLSMLTVPGVSSSPNSIPWLNAKTTLTAVPSLVILHEPSAYFLTNESLLQKSTISSYLSLVTHALSSLSFLTRHSQAQTRVASFALFDSQLDLLKFPMTKQPMLRRDDPEEKVVARQEHVYTFVHRYFEWLIQAEQDVAFVDGLRRKRTMVLSRNDQVGEPDTSWVWWEAPDEAEGQHTTRLFWQE